MSSKHSIELQPDWLTAIQERCTSSLKTTGDILNVNIFILKHYSSEIHDCIVSEVSALFVEDNEEQDGRNSELLFSSQVWPLCQRLRWTRLFRKAFIKGLCNVLATKTKEICDQGVEEECLPTLHQWFDSSIIPFLSRISIGDDDDEELLDDLRHHINECFVQERSLIIFDLIRDFPESNNTLVELQQSLHNAPTHRIALVGHSLRNQVTKRLLHIAVATAQILDFYIQMIKVCRLLDSSDLLLTYAAHPVRVYLQSQRRDAIRGVIVLLTDRTAAATFDHTAKDKEHDEDGEDGMNWQPLPKIKELSTSSSSSSSPSKRNKGDKTASNQSGKGLDILGTLVSIYPSSDLFMSEYRLLLSERLLDAQRQPHVNLHSQLLPELRMNIELLKLRFGEDALQYCEIMLRDVEESRRVQTAIMAATANSQQVKEGDVSNNNSFSFPVEMLIVSEHYWPAQQFQVPSSDSSNDPPPLSSMMDTADSNKGVKHAGSIQRQLDEFHAAYHNLKKPRKLFALPQHGAVEIELTFDDDHATQRMFLCSPIQADVITLLQQEKEEVNEIGTGGATTSGIASQLQITEEEAMAALLFWKTRHVLIVHPTVAGCFVVDEEQARWAAAEEDHHQATAATRRKKKTAATEDDAMDDGDDEGDDANNSDMMLEEELSFSFEESPNNHNHTSNHNSAANNEQKRKAAAQYAISFITGLLRSHGGMLIDRLQPLLAVTLRAALEADQSDKGLTSNDLSFAWSKVTMMQFMQQYLVGEGIVDCVSGVYSMPSFASS